MKIFFLTILIQFLFVFNSYAEHNMRKCMLLPITDNVSGAIGDKVFAEVENYLKESNWCFYKSNSEILSILNDYNRNLESYLQNKDVLKTIADRLTAGSLIRVKVTGEASGVTVLMDVLGGNGEDIFYSEKVILEKDEISPIAQTIKNWLDIYEKTIPYDGKVIGVLGDQITLDIGKNYKVKVGDELQIRRPLNKRKHPLLKRIVEWETVNLGNGKIINVSDNQALGLIKVYESQKRILTDDWVKIERSKGAINTDLSYPELKANQFGKLGTLSIYGELGKGSTSTSIGGQGRKFSGTLFGASARGELWVTRNYFINGEIGRRLGSYRKTSGTTDRETSSLAISTMKGYVGYRYLPMGFFYGPQIEFMGGYVRYGYNHEESATDGLGENSISGLAIALGVNTPVMKDIRAHLRLEFLPMPSFKEDSEIYGSSSSESSFQVETGVKYAYNPIMSLDGSVQLTSNKIEFQSSNSELEYQDFIFKLGTTFTF